MASKHLKGVTTLTLTTVGVTKVRVKAVAQSGAVAYSDVSNIIIDTMPSLEFDPPLPSRIRVRGVLPIRFKVNDLEGDGISFNLFDNGVSLVTGTISREAYVSFDWFPVAGTHTITMQLSDGFLTTAVLEGPTVTVVPYRNIHET